MRKDKISKGFTLVELLVAATIIGILAVFATNSYRAGVAETRWEQAKANANRLATAVQRFQLDYPKVHFSVSPMSNAQTCSSIYYSSEMSISPACLIPYGYLDAADWNSGYFSYYVCDQLTSAPCNKRLNSEKPVACVKVNNQAKMPSKYLSYVYCFFGRQGGKEFI